MTTVARHTPPLPYAATLPTRPMRRVAPPTVERPLLELLPPVPPRPLPARLSPRRTSRTVRARRTVARLVHGTTADRLFLLLAVAAAAAVITGMVLGQAHYGIDVTDVSR